MKSNGIDDILIDASQKQEKSRGGIIFIFILILLLIIGVALYYYYFIMNKEDEISKKDLFFNQIANTNIKEMLTNNVIETIYSKLQKNNYEIENTINFTNTLDIQNSSYLKDLDFSKFIIDLNSKRNIEDERSISELYLKYSGNDIFNFKVYTTDNEIALYSDEIYEKYVAINYDDISKILKTDIDFDMLKNKNKLDFTKKDLENYFNEYRNLVLENLTEEMFSIDEKYVIRTDTEDLQERWLQC